MCKWLIHIRRTYKNAKSEIGCDDTDKLANWRGSENVVILWEKPPVKINGFAAVCSGFQSLRSAIQLYSNKFEEKPLNGEWLVKYAVYYFICHFQIFFLQILAIFDVS